MNSKKMMHTQGIVTKIDENGDAIVVMNRQNACGGCGSNTASACKACLSGSKIQAKVLNTQHAKQGDIVSVSLSTSKVLKGAAAFYLIPVAGIIFGGLIGAAFHEVLSISETFAALIFGGIGLMIGFYIVKLISEKMNVNKAMMPVISKIIYSKSGKQSIATNTNSDLQTCA